MIEPRYPQLVANLFAKHFPDGGIAEAPAPNRTDGILLVQRAMAQKALRRRLQIGGFAFAAVAAGVAAAFVARPFGSTADREAIAPAAFVQVVVSEAGDGTVVPPRGAPVPLGADTVLAPGSRVHVGAGRAHLALSTGTRVVLDPSSDVTLKGAGSSAVFDLTEGSMRAEVAKLANGERFVVHTVDSEIEVRGTSFRVSVVPLDASCGDGATTRVSVYEGVVAVRNRGREDHVAKGEEWPRGCERTGFASPLPPAVIQPSQGFDAVRPRKASSSPEVSILARENDDYAEAMLARRGADASRGVAALDRFLAKHPSSHLAEDALAEKMELQSTVDLAKASVTARLYLARYPNGFARRTADDILGRAR